MTRAITLLVAPLLVACTQPPGPGPDGGAADAGESADAGQGDAGSGADAGSCLDLDGDGVCHAADCDDAAPLIPSAAEVCGNALDDDCDGRADDGCVEQAALFYVDRGSRGGPCADTNPGTITSPWCTIGKANRTLVAGQTALLRAGTYDETIAPVNSGTSETQRIAFAAFPGETVTITGVAYGIRLESRSYVTVEGIAVIDATGMALLISASSNVNIGFCRFENPGGPGSNWAGARVRLGSTRNRIYGSTFSRWGKQTVVGTTYDDTGCLLDIGNDSAVDRSDQNLVIGNTFSYGGHHLLGVYSSDNVVRANTFHNENWYACHRTQTNQLCGNRNVILNTSFPAENVRNVIEDNVIAFSGVPPDQDSSSGLAVRTQHNVIRRNRLFSNDATGLSLTADSGNGNDASNNLIYANVLYRNGFPRIDTWTPMKAGMLLARWVDNAQHNAMTNVAIKNNIIHSSQQGAIFFYYVTRAAQQVEGNWEEAGDPLFVSLAPSPTPQDLAAMDFHLRSASPCIDRGVFLTRTTSAGSGTTVPVERAGYFSDGRGLVPPDFIQLEGQTTTVQITSVDVGANTISVARPLSWGAGTGVSLPFAGARPDQGAFEAGW
ncbi:MAG: right-handed parallel beta-helix repeat-containing protein [Deltaproteobacteria bacterium]|nr:right-handed parallel beta-helix repeat-containing protein [Deltaproteobacteria bacterium]